MSDNKKLIFNLQLLDSLIIISDLKITINYLIFFELTMISKKKSKKVFRFGEWHLHKYIKTYRAA